MASQASVHNKADHDALCALQQPWAEAAADHPVRREATELFRRLDDDALKVPDIVVLINAARRPGGRCN
ncbi:hypothetical protein [Rhodococcus koreensis]